MSNSNINGWELSKPDYRQLFQNVPCYISVIDRGFRIIQTNRLFREDFGDCEGKLCYKSYKRRSEPCLECPVSKTFADGEVYTGEQHVITRHGEEAFMLVYSSPLRNDQEDIIAVMEMSTNITQLKQLQTGLTMMGAAVTSMAHKIKNVLTGLDGGIYLVNSGLNQENRDKTVKGWNIVQKNVERIETVVKDILYCARDREHDLTIINPNDVIKEIYTLFRETSAMKEIYLAMELDQDLESMKSNEESLHTIINNLLNNAIEACRFDLDKQLHAVLIRTKRKGPLAIFEVIDNGHGFPEEYKDCRFNDAVFQTRGNYGTGLGLMVTRKLVHELGGSITFSSYPKKGSTFRVTFPIQ
ncbi:MAG TPA: PAS domain-containing sensor histidine kinase [Syntrophales bacterium]|nr:PAS domain-containing sensor histidine kinase [Syntrophales bacterium]HPQ45015.1 PAS domain-containing sensor histidine kinase [Syntrophales bacterium]